LISNRARPAQRQILAIQVACTAALYGGLAQHQPSAIVQLNRAVAIAMAEGPAVGLAMLDRLEAEGTLAGYHLLPAARADLLRRAGRDDEAARAYAQAIEMTSNEAERRYLAQRRAGLIDGST
jgi:RNA polymerase sigma-70 factor (ECF subfamily)